MGCRPSLSNCFHSFLPLLRHIVLLGLYDEKFPQQAKNFWVPKYISLTIDIAYLSSSCKALILRHIEAFLKYYFIVLFMESTITKK